MDAQQCSLPNSRVKIGGEYYHYVEILLRTKTCKFNSNAISLVYTVSDLQMEY